MVLRRLSALPTTPAVEDLREKADGFLQQVAGWQHAAPAPEAREKLMKGVLALHVLVAKLERDAPT